MTILKKIGNFFEKFMALIILAVAILALFVPQSCLWINPKWINPLLMLVMFGMGLTLKFEDFALIFTQPKDILIGCAAQFTIMPLLAFALGKAFNLETGLLVGVILVGTCPGGTASNVITYLSKGDLALSVGMTSINTLLAPILTPAITYLLLKESIHVDVASMFLSIATVVIIPIGLGLLINKFFGKYIEKIKSVLPGVSIIAIALIIGTIIARNAQKILTTGAIVFAVVILHNLLGFGCGFGLAKLLRLNAAKTKAIAIEIGMQNSGLASSLAATSFPSLAMATVPGAIFSVWHNMSGTFLANIFSQWDNECEECDKEDEKNSE